MEWVTAHWQDIWAAVSAVIVAAHLITELTPTQRDDKIIGKILNLLEVIGLKVGKSHRHNRLE